jgi:hypothetical protein
MIRLVQLPGFKCNSMHILSREPLREWTEEEPKVPSGKGLRGRTMRAVSSLIEAYLKGMTVCCEVHPTLGTEPQNILTDGMYLVMLLAVGAVRLNT